MKCSLLLFLLVFLPFSSSDSSCTCSCKDTRMEELGSATWKMMHSLAYNYPHQPAFHLKYAWYNVFELLVHNYPCQTCRDHLWDNIERYGVHVANRTDLSMWLCWLHNDVNKQRNKQVYDCSMENLRRDYGYTNATISENRMYLD